MFCRQRRPLAVALVALAAFWLGGCSGDSLFPMSAEPDRTELTEWQQESFLKAAIAVLPEEAADDIPSGQAQHAARFVARTLETAPDGQVRRWKSADSGTALVVRPLVTEVNGGSICRDFRLEIEIEGKASHFTSRACRMSSGIWRL